MHSTPEYRSKPEVEKLPNEWLLSIASVESPSVYWITLNGSWMIHQCFHLLFGRIWEEGESLFCFCLFCWLDKAENEMIMRSEFFFHCRYGLLSWKLAIICMKPKHKYTCSALTISWWLKQLFLQTKEQQIPPQIPWKHYLSFKQEYAALKCMPNEQNKQTNKQTSNKKSKKTFHTS